MNGINRNPTEMLNYASKFEKSIEVIENELEGTIRDLNIYVSELDQKSQECVEKFENDCKELYNQLEEYRNLVKLLRKNANDINDIISSTRF